MNNGSAKLNYLLVMPRLIQKAGDGYSFPLGIAYISSSMKEAGYNVKTLNLNHVQGDVAEIITQQITTHGIDVVATGGLSFQYNTIKSIVAAAKQVNGNIVTIVGGGLITGDPEPAMEALEYVDYGVIGEGEATIAELCSTVESCGSPDGVAGIIYKREEQYITTDRRKERDNIDTIPWPDYEGFGLSEYLRSAPPGISGMNKQNVIFMLASRSCPFNCTFCFHTIGQKYRQRSLDAFFKELDYLVGKYKIDFICLADELFAKDAERMSEFCGRIKQYNVHWWAQFRVGSTITPQLLTMLKESGCEVMSFGLESASNHILKSMRKHTTVEEIEATLQMVYDAQIAIEGAFIFGDIEETYQTATTTLEWWREHLEYKINLNLITVYPGSYLYKYAWAQNIIEDRVKFLKDGCPQINVTKMANADWAALVRDILEAPMNMVKTLTVVTLHGTDYSTGRVDMSGCCPVCDHETCWPSIKLFATNTLSCAKCGQKYNISLPPQLRANIESNMTKLVEVYDKVAIWGINYHTADLFKNSAVLQGEHIYPIDISATKRNMDLYGKKIYSPDVIDTMDVKIVIIAIPAYLTQISSQVKTNHKNVLDIVDICLLVDPDFGVRATAGA